jgi:hypothetical protein
LLSAAAMLSMLGQIDPGDLSIGWSQRMASVPFCGIV